MTQLKQTSTPDMFLIALTVLSIGVLTGCDYCTPLLFAVIIGRLLIGVYRMVSEALSIQPLVTI